MIDKKKKPKKLWDGRFSKPLAKSAERFTASVHFDIRLYKQDLLQSIAYARALFKVKILTGVECNKIIHGLEEILRGIENKRIILKAEYEDVHMNIETLLIEKVGDVGKKLHSGRSRNDQVATDLRMYLKGESEEIMQLINKLQKTFLEMADKYIGVIMPGYTHLQRAQPVLFSHHMMAYFEMLCRDYERFQFAHLEADVMPLGSAALAGTSFKIDREALAKDLGFSRISRNSLDAVSDRDFVIEFIEACALTMMHLSRFSEELILWSSYEFDYVELSDQYATGSSIMPQKKNPDIAELIRGKTGRVYGHLMGMLTMMKALPLAYNRDMQEDKEPVFDCADTMRNVLSILDEVLATTKINREQMERSAKKGYLTATDMAYYLVRKGIPFREAHRIVGKIVFYCEESNMELEYLSLQQLKQFSDLFGYDAMRILSAKSSVENKDIPGGTAPNQVKEAIKNARKKLLHD